MEMLGTAVFHQNSASFIKNKQRQSAGMRLTLYRDRQSSAEFNRIRHSPAILLNYRAVMRPAFCLLLRYKIEVRRNPPVQSVFVELPKIVLFLFSRGKKEIRRKYATPGDFRRIRAKYALPAQPYIHQNTGMVTPSAATLT